jgi:hypothetical protein
MRFVPVYKAPADGRQIAAKAPVVRPTPAKPLAKPATAPKKKPVKAAKKTAPRPAKKIGRSTKRK